MKLPSDPIVLLKIAGALCTGIGSLLLAWRAKEILKWTVYCLVAHERAIVQLRLLAARQPQTEVIVEGVTSHLLDVQAKVGVVLFVLGFALLGTGMLCNALTYLIG